MDRRAPGDGPQEFHLILLDGGRTDVLADEVGRAALHCIRCSACLNVCPVYERVGGQAYESVYPGPIGAILTPLLKGLDQAPSLPWASSLCGACYEVCPVKIDIPSILIHLRGRVVREEKSKLTPEALAMKGMAAAFSTRRRYEAAQRLAKLGRGPIAKAAIPGWTAMRDLPEPPKETFRDWWKREHGRRLTRSVARRRPRCAALGARSALVPEMPRDVPRRRLDPARTGSSSCSARPSPSTARPCTGRPTSPPPSARSSARASAIGVPRGLPPTSGCR